MTKVGIVIVNYNGLDYQQDALRTLFEMTEQGFKVILVDSASKDGSADVAIAAYPEIILLRQDENVGVAAGNNIGIRKSIEIGCEYTLLLNNDVEVAPDLLEKLLASADEHTIVVPKIYYHDPNDVLWYAGGELSWEQGNGVHEGGFKDNVRANTRRVVTYSPTCCMLIHNSIFERIGMIDEAYFMYSDDTDFCARIDLDPELTIIYEPSAFMWHKVSSSTGGGMNSLKMFYIARNRFFFIDKFGERVGPCAKRLAKRQYCYDMLRMLVKGEAFKDFLGCYRGFRKGIAAYNAGEMGRYDGKI